MRVLLVYPSFPKTYWGAEHSLALTGKKSMLPPLGLITVAALLPPSWPVRLADLNVCPLDPADLDWADVVFVSGMLVQKESLHAVARLARARGKRVVAGGAYASTSPDALAPEVDCVVVGEAEELMATLVEALEADALPARLEADEYPDVKTVPTPRYELLDVSAYQSIGVQWSRGCPFNCEFCDIIEIFGRRARTKTPAQLCTELDAVFATGFRGSLFIVDDNFIGNKVEARRLLGPLAAWMRAHGDPFYLYTEASLNLATDDALIDAMVDAGFNSVFIGIETPSDEALRHTQKLQNTTIDAAEAVRKLNARGIEVMAGFIVGFDTDDADAVERQRAWIGQSPIPLAMVGILIALPGTQLERRLEREGRLVHESGGDNFMRTNFVTTLD
ncbi:MAG TPA: radical SAM protein, partial [Polyangia bacterium]